jgi:predicted TIM-barrel fold metal-dependent hydrolase
MASVVNSGNNATCEGPVSNPRKPRTDVPPGASDTHAHIFGPASRFPYIGDRSYTPPDALLNAYKELLATLGFDRAVLVQPSIYGTDNRALLEALSQAGPNFRGICVVDDTISNSMLEQMHALGVRGIRGNFMNKGGITFDALERLAWRLQAIGWHVQLFLNISEYPDFAYRVRKLPVEVVIDHMGFMPTTRGVDHPAFRELLNLVEEDRCWVKLSGPYRITSSTRPPYPDVRPFARSLIEANADRLVWATDWPHPDIHVPMPNDGDLVDTLADWAPDPTVRRKILVDNPAKLYGFPSTFVG